MKLALSAIITLFSVLAFAGSPFRDLDQLQSNLGFDRYYGLNNSGRTLRIAVLDKGFDGYQKEIGRTLPAKTRYVPGPVIEPSEVKVQHGLRMAQILTALMTNEMNTRQWEPQLTLYNVFGFSNFKAAIDDMIATKIDVVLYSEVWEYGGNFDGKGFINAQVNRATKAGIVWVNAAGNFALTTYNSGIRTGENQWVQLPDQNQALSLRCQPPGREKTCNVKVVLSWNDFKNDINPGTNKDLDLVLADDLLNIIQVGGLKQSDDPRENRPQYSKYPREIVTAQLKKGNYFIRVKDQSQNFSDRDILRITVDGEGVEMPSRTSNETLLNPADNASVITVGASDSDRSSSSQKLNKPDIYAPSSMKLKNNEEFRGSSNSAAIVAAGIGILKSLQPRIKKEELLNKLSGGRGGDAGQRGLSLYDLGFAPTGPGCFLQSFVHPVPYFIGSVLAQGGVLVQTTAALRIMTAFDPIRLAPNLRRWKYNDMVVTTPRGFELYPRGAFVPSDAVEVFQTPQEAGLCQNSASPGRNFRLP